MPENNESKSISMYNDLAVKMADRIPAVLIAFVIIFLIFMAGLFYSAGYLPSNQRLVYLCIIIIPGFVSFLLSSIFIYKTVVFIIKNKESGLLNHE